MTKHAISQRRACRLDGVDCIQIQQLVVNLMRDAIDAMDGGRTPGCY